MHHRVAAQAPGLELSHGAVQQGRLSRRLQTQMCRDQKCSQVCLRGNSRAPYPAAMTWRLMKVKDDDKHDEEDEEEEDDEDDMMMRMKRMIMRMIGS